MVGWWAGERERDGQCSCHECIAVRHAGRAFTYFDRLVLLSVAFPCWLFLSGLLRDVERQFTPSGDLNAVAIAKVIPLSQSLFKLRVTNAGRKKAP